MIPDRDYIKIKVPLSQLYDLINLPLPGGFLFFVFRIVSGSNTKPAVSYRAFPRGNSGFYFTTSRGVINRVE